MKKVNEIPSDSWNEYEFRQKEFEVHRHTQTIPVLFDEDFRMVDPTPTKWYTLFEEDVRNLKQKSFQVYGEGYIIRLLLVKLKAKKSIPSHTDGGPSLNLAKRIHVPLVTTNEVIFTVGGKEQKMKAGEMWEINNTRRHSVYNQNKKDRINLIFDYIPLYKGGHIK